MTKKIEFEELRHLVESVSSDERRMNVRFGCDCGCGGDSFTIESWKQMCEEADEAREKLESLGVEFNDEED